MEKFGVNYYEAAQIKKYLHKSEHFAACNRRYSLPEYVVLEFGVKTMIKELV